MEIPTVGPVPQLESTAMSNSSDRIHRFRIFLLLVTFCLSIYMLTYRALIQSGDTRRSLDAATSYVRYGDWLMDETNWVKLPYRIRESTALPLGEYRVQERLHILLASPLLRLADALPRLGGIHTVWLFNVIVTALIGGIVYLLLRAMSYSDMVAAIVALSASLGTNLWAYSQTFFREPLTALLILVALHALQWGRQSSAGGRLFSVLLAAIGLFLAYETKNSAIFAIPAIVVFALPDARFGSFRAWRAAMVAFALLPLACLVLLMLLVPLPAPLLNALAGMGRPADYLSAALRSYILSPGASVWATSPLTLLAIPGGIVLWRRGQLRLVSSICLLFAGYSLGHALLTGPHWSGGLSWPPRFLLPMLPVLMLATAPIAEAMLRGSGKRLKFVWAVLLCYGIWIQFVGVSLSLNRYSESLPPESNGFAEWEPAQLQPRYFRWVVLPGRWGDLGFEFLWARANLPVWVLSFALYSALAAAALARLLRQPQHRWRHLSPLLALLGLPLILLSLASAFDKDPQTQSGQRALREALDFLTANARADDVLLLTGADYEDFILNHMDGAAPRPIILERPPAQAASDRQPAPIVSQNPNDWFEVQSFRTLRHLTETLDRLWILDNTSPFFRWSFRPLERYLAQHYYPLGEVKLPTVDDTVRLLEFSTRGGALNPLRPFAGDIATDLRYGASIGLLSLVLPNGNAYEPGETIELSLLWETDAPLEHDYTVAWFIADKARKSPIIQGLDSGPQNGFAPTSSWQPGFPVWDNRALRLPMEAPPGDYQIWALMYRQESGSGELIRLPVSGTTVIEDASIGVLPVALAIE